MSDHEDETITAENAPPKNVPQITTGNSAKSMTTDTDGSLKIRPPITTEEHQQKFEEFKVSEEDGLDKGYDKMQKILTQMNTLKIKPDPEDVNMKFLRGLPSSWSGIALILKTKGGLEYITFDDLYNKLKFLEIDTKGYSSNSSTLSNAAFVSTSSSKSKCNVVDDVIYSFFANHEIDQQLVYEDLDQINKDKFKEYDLKHKMEMLSIKVHRFEKKHGWKIMFNGRENARFDKKLVKCFNCKQMGHFSRECRAQGVHNSNNYQKYKSKEAGKNGTDSKAMVVVDGNTDSQGAVVSADSVISADGSVLAGTVVAVAVSPSSNTEFALMGHSTEGQPIYNRFALVDNMKAVPPPLTGNYMPPSNIPDIDESQMVYGKKATDSSKIKTNDDSITYSNDSVLFDFSDSYLHLIKDCDLHEQRLVKRHAKGKGILGRRPTGKTVNLNKPKPIFAGKPKPVSAGKTKPVSAGKPKPVSTGNPKPVYAGLQNTVSAGPPNLVYAGDGLIGPRPLNIQPMSTYFHSFTHNNQQIIFPITHNSLYLLYMTGGLNGKTAVKPSAGWPWTKYGMLNTKGSKINGGSKSKSWFEKAKDRGIVDSGCSRSMSENKDKLEDFEAFDGGEVTFRGIQRDYSNPKTPQQNGVIERKNQTLIEASRTMLANSYLPTIFWTKAVATACYVLNRVLVTKPYAKTPYELLTGNKPSISYLKPCGCHVTIFNTSDSLGKFDKKSDEGYIVGYSISSKAYREDDSDSDDEPDVLIIHSTPTPVVPIVDEATIQHAGINFDQATTNVDNLDEFTELQSLQRQEQAGTEEADRLGLAFPSLNPILDVDSASIGSSISASATPPVSAGSTLLMSPCASPIFADRPSISAGKSHVPAVRLSISTCRSIYANRSISTGIPVSAGRPSCSAARTPIPVGRILGKVTESTSSNRFPRASSVENSDFHDTLTIFVCRKSGIFTSSSYDKDFSGPDANNLESSFDVNSIITKRIHTIHPTSQVIGDINSPVQTRSQISLKGASESAFISYINDQRRNNHPNFQLCMFSCFLSQEEPTSVAHALADPDWVEAMQAEIQQFRNQKVWVLVKLPEGKRAIGTKWILKNKRDARGIVCRNKVRLVAQGHRHEEGIDYIDVFAPVARIEAIRLFLAFASFIGFKVYQMDVKSAFLYGKIPEEVYVTQPKGFEDPDHPKKVYKVVKALYGLHQAPRAWYECLSTFLLKHRYRRGTIDRNLFIKKNSNDIMLVQVYVDDIIFGSTRKDWCEEFETLMQSEFEMSSMGPLTFFLGLPVDQRPDGIFIHQTKSMIGCLMYLTATRPDIMFALSYPKLGLWYPRDSPFDLEAFSDSDYAGADGERKSTTGGCQFLRKRLISWQCKKQTIVATSHCEAEYVAAASCCGQDANEKKLIQVLKIPTEHNVADLLTKSFDVTRFGYLVVHIGNYSPLGP
nr:hypothetical protein [Tanacetum cinerariifolium]